METAAFEPQVLVLATRLKGEETIAPLAGAVTLMANAGAVPIASANMKQKNAFMSLPWVTIWEWARVLAVSAKGAHDLNSELVTVTKVLGKICWSGCIVLRFSAIQPVRLNRMS
jgi:hypothetical protein